MANKNLTNAKKAKNDEFYTQFSDIQKEVESYLEYDPKTFKGKVVYSNCDDPFESNFFRYFVLNFNKLGLKQLITTSYKPSPVANTQLGLFGDDKTLIKSKGRPKVTANKFIINEVGDVDGDGSFTLKDIAKQLKTNKNNEWTPLDDDGDFRSDECVELLKKSDIVVTNPPFSLFREYITQLFEHKKQFLIIGNLNAITEQEILNAVYSGHFVTKAREEFSNSQNANVQKWSAYIAGDIKRQAYLERALDWVSGGDIDIYMSKHRKDTNITELKKHFNTVIDWVSITFIEVESEMRGLEWNRLYETYHKKKYNPATVSALVQKLYGDGFVKNRRGIFEYVLGGEVDTKLLEVRVFDDPTKRSVYESQTTTAKKKGVSNCPHCAIGHDANKDKIWSLTDMDADHVSAWSKGGATDAKNCQMLCKTHNRAKGNR